MKTFFIGIIAFVLILGLKSFLLRPVDLSVDDQIIKSVTGKEIKELIKEKTQIIIDVRTSGEFNSGAIENAINMDCSTRGFKTKLEKLDKNKSYVIYCASGSRSRSCLKLMKNIKFKEVYELSGGIVKFN